MTRPIASSLRYFSRRIADEYRVNRIARDLAERKAWNVGELEQHQKKAFLSLVAYAKRHSDLYRNLYASVEVNDALRMEDLPVLDKNTVMMHFDSVVTDPCLKLQSVQRHLSELRHDDYYLGKYRVFRSSGTTGQVGVFVYDRDAWNTIQANRIRTGSLGRWPEKRRTGSRGVTALVLSNRLDSVSIRSAFTTRLFDREFAVVDARLRIDEMLATLDELQPARLVGGSSTLAQLAIAQADGKLHIKPEEVVAGAEMLTTTMVTQIEAAWGRSPHQTYGMTESPSLGFHCPLRPLEVHLCEDLGIVEVVDAQNRLVPNGTPGTRILLTNLYNYTQPLIRYQISDVITIAGSPCACGVPFRRIVALDGRSEDILRLPGVRSGHITFRPVQVGSTLGQIAGLGQFQVVQENDHLNVFVVRRDQSASREALTGQVQSLLEKMFRDSLAHPTPITVSFVPELLREPGGKVKLIKSRLSELALPP